MAEALKASLSASKMTFDETQVQELVAALWEDAGLDGPTDSMDLNGLHTLLSQHEGLVEGLVKSITTLVLPPKEREKRKEAQLSLSDRHSIYIRTVISYTVPPGDWLEKKKCQL